MSSDPYSRVPRTAEGIDRPKLGERLEKIWATAPGIAGFFSTVDHKKIGLRYLITAFIFLIAGGCEALIFRVQLATPNAHVVTPEQYDELFSMHGISMIFLYASPVLSGFSNYLWPLLIGSRDMALPRINALSYWTYLCAGIFMYVGFFLGYGPNDGWFNYLPYANTTYNPGPNMDFYALGMIFLGFSTTVGAINFVVTFIRLRAPGMSLNRVSILLWGTMTVSVGNILAIPSVDLAFFFLWMDRQFGTHFYDPTAGGQPLLWQHLFWIFAHPWVYVIVLPAMSIVSDGLPVFCRRPLVGHTAVALATVATMVLGFGVWVHHMFATGLPAGEMAFFSAASIIIAVPSAVSVFAWVATIWTGRPVFKTPFLFFAGFVLLFVMGGVSGFVTGSLPADLQLTDTYFVVAHIHYVLIGINVFPVVGGIYFWFPKWTGRMMNERLGKWSFWVMFLGFNFGFFPMHISGLLGMPRRIYTYGNSMGWDTLNMITTIGAFIFAFGILLFLINVLISRKRGAPAGPNPWDAPTLEWSVSSPPPEYNFETIPIVASRHPLWEERLNETKSRTVLENGLVLDRGREVIATTGLDSEADVILKMPGDSYAPIILALSLSGLFVGLLLMWWWLVALSGFAVLADIVGWIWPEAALAQRAEPA